MRVALAAAIVVLASSAYADNPRAMHGETIRIEGKGPPRVPPKPHKRYERIAPRYSDYAIEHDVWARAWLLLDIDEHGVVTRLKLLEKPGYDLDEIAIERGFSMRFDPAEDGNGHAIRSQLVTTIEWPSYWWLITFEGIATKIPDYTRYVPCAGSGPLHLDSVHPVYRDCTPPPDSSELAHEPWIVRR